MHTKIILSHLRLDINIPLQTANEYDYGKLLPIGLSEQLTSYAYRSYLYHLIQNLVSELITLKRVFIGKVMMSFCRNRLMLLLLCTSAPLVLCCE